MPLAQARSRRCKGRLFEEKAALDLCSVGYAVVDRNLRSPFAEIDLVVRSPKGAVIIIEVKASGWPDGQVIGLSRRQALRLERARQWLSEELRSRVKAIVLVWSDQAWVVHQLSEFI